MSKEDVSITHENNIFYCTKNNTKFISVDGEKWYGEEKRITELENKIADIKANCDLAIEGRDIKIKELETENAKLKSVVEFQQSSNMKRHFEIQKLERENAELKDLIKNIIRVTWGEGWNYSLDWKVKAEQFIKEIEK